MDKTLKNLLPPNEITIHLLGLPLFLGGTCPTIVHSHGFLKKSNDLVLIYNHDFFKN
jgi:hypothetical protein